MSVCSWHSPITYSTNQLIQLIQPINPSASRRLLLLFLLCGLWIIPGSASAQQQEGCKLQISLLTCGTGSELYATFGHSAVRVYDSLSQSDYVFNYGTFDFSDPHFYWKFMRGKLMYFLSVQDFPSFIQEYQADGRSVTEQVLNLSCAEKEQVWQFLQKNYLPENRLYKYDFIFDNCSTRIRDIFSTNFGDQWKTPAILPRKEVSFRQIINSYLSGNPWEKLGINLLFGMPTDARMTNWNIMFLPDYLMKGAAGASLDGRPFVARTTLLIPPANAADSGSFRLTPLLLFILVCGPLLLLGFSRNRRARQFLQWTDRFLFFLAGILGCFILFMWLGTDHQVCRWNWNLAWALPTHLVFSLLMDRKTQWTKWYAAISFILDLLLILCWFFLPQQLPPAMIPVILLLLAGAWRVYRRPLPAGKTFST